MANDFNGLMPLSDALRGFNAGEPAVAKLLRFILAPLARLAAMDEFAAKRDLFIPTAGLDDARNDDVPPTVRFATLATARFTDANLEMTTGRPKLDADEFEREDAVDSLLTATGSLREWIAAGTVGVEIRAGTRKWNYFWFYFNGSSLVETYHWRYWLHSLVWHLVQMSKSDSLWV